MPPVTKVGVPGEDGKIALGTARFRLSSETKGTFKYEECDKYAHPTPYDMQKIGTLYIKKRTLSSVLGSKVPNIITLTIACEPAMANREASGEE